MLPGLVVGSLENELRLTRILLRRALEAEQRDDGELPLLTLTMADGEARRQYRRISHEERIGRLIDRIAKLEGTQAKLESMELDVEMLVRKMNDGEL